MLRAGVYKELASFSLEASLHLERGEFLALQGKSGSGKTTLLRIIAGLESAKGAIEVDGELWLDGSKTLPPQKRSIGFVFQDYALFPNMCVIENLLYVHNDKALAYHLLDLCDMKDLAMRYPHELSGGQKQRVALARAYMRKPKIMLLDEPLAALDPVMRSFLQTKIKELHEEFEATTIMVSHDIGEIYRLADRIAIMEAGKIKAFKEKRDFVGPGKHLAEVVGVGEKFIEVAFIGGIYRLPKMKEYQIGELVEVNIEGLRVCTTSS
ncbi:ABC transporter ATP-binding protein [Nitratiruptor sp. YY09-18]|uniref:ABC transporter ATP-binding protein n=1 Tax=Nitratiruptor sp. YY09-18 TaxID=2724901 RepID=UPI001915C54A|nr:ABC transporter ATP-binding protein [Nitratiruptor sp. YY09-18]BCD67300.1 molybdate transport system ATP-binding protein [Nitratiruptor sp. YY09-18]